MIILIITFLLQTGIISTTQEFEELSTGEQQQYITTYQSQIITEDLGEM
jgi:hypothetical protein